MQEIENFNRADIFQRYHKMQNPFIIITTPIKVTNLVNYTKTHHHFYAILGYLIGSSVNEIKEFRYRYINDKYYLYDKVGVSFTEKIDDEIVFFDCFESELEKFISEYDMKKQEVLTTKKSLSKEENNLIWVSSEPWINFSSLISPFDKSITIPQFIWDKYIEKDGEYYCNLMIMIHHGFADGQHINQFLKNLEEKITKLK